MRPPPFSSHHTPLRVRQVLLEPSKSRQNWRDPQRVVRKRESHKGPALNSVWNRETQREQASSPPPLPCKEIGSFFSEGYVGVRSPQVGDKEPSWGSFSVQGSFEIGLEQFWTVC